jgi:D-3-phosphoglycerate dehydrogenase
MMKVALLDDFHSLIPDTLAKWGWEIINAQTWTEKDFINLSKDLDGIFIRSSIPLNENVLRNAKSLKFIARPGAGLENIDLKYCQNNNISVFRSPEGNRDAVAEHTVGMVLMLLNNLKRADSEVRDGMWNREKNRGHELMGKTFAIIGYGFMGRALAKRLQGFGVDIIAYDKYISGFGTEIVKEVSLDDIFNSADFVSLHTPLNKDTIGLVNDSFIDSFKKPFVLINTARGKSVILKDLISALELGTVKGACLDVLELELSSFEQVINNDNSALSKLSNLSNVILSPHIAGWTFESKHKMAKFILEKVKNQFLNK